MILDKNITSALENIYISPLETCNLSCRLCYTHKTRNVLSNQQIINFINRYSKHVSLKSVLFCGGEVFLLPNFIPLINKLVQKGLFITLITNGTIDKLNDFSDPKNCQLLVSLDGPKLIHDSNRGQGNYYKSIQFIKKAINLGFPVEIMFLVTPESYQYKDEFPKILEQEIGQKINLNYITQKTFFYTANHPLSNQNNINPALAPEQIIDIKKHYPSVPSKNFGCFQLSIQSNGLVYGCCESPYELGTISTPIKQIITKLSSSLKICKQCNFASCHGCCCPDFLCGYKKELNSQTCQKVVQSFL